MFGNKPYELYKGDCLEVMDRLIEQGIKVDMVLCDPPYGTTSCKWDSIIPFDKMWERLNKLRNRSTPMLLFGSEPFGSFLRCSNIEEYKYDWYINKKKPQGFANAKKMPLKSIETVSVFYSKLPTYNPQNLKKVDRIIKNSKSKTNNENHVSGQNGGSMSVGTYTQEYTNYPRQVIDAPPVWMAVHPTQKPVELLEYLIKTYTNDGDIVLDFTMGSGSTGVACMNTNRKFIGIELDNTYYDIAEKRVEEALQNKDL